MPSNDCKMILTYRPLAIIHISKIFIQASVTIIFYRTLYSLFAPNKFMLRSFAATLLCLVGVNVL